MVTADTLTDAEIREFLRNTNKMDEVRHCLVALGVEVYDHDSPDGQPEARCWVANAINARAKAGR
jgi:SLT domain-containing protein